MLLHGDVQSWPPATTVDLVTPQPYDAGALLGFFAQRAIRGIEQADAYSYARTLRLPHGHGFLRVSYDDDSLRCEVGQVDERDRDIAVERARWLLDVETDPSLVDAHLARSHLLRSSVARHPGLRVPGHVDGFEVAVRAVVGQQISVAGARTIAERLTLAYGDRICDEEPLTHLFPTAESIAAVDPETLPMPRARGRCLVGLAGAVADGRVRLDRSMELGAVEAALKALPGIGPWTADYIALRALGDRDVFLASDLGVRQGLARLGVTTPAADIAEQWRPWRSYAQMHVWAALSDVASTEPAGGTGQR